MHNRTKNALASMLRKREELRDKLATRSKNTYINNALSRARITECMERELADLTAIIDFVQEGLAVAEARGPAMSGIGPFALSADQRAAVLLAEKHLVRDAEWYGRRMRSNNMPRDHYDQAMRELEAVRSCLNIVLRLPVDAPKTPGQKAFEARQAQYERGSKGTCTPVTWDEQTARSKEEWEEVARSVLVQ